jgi:hypothetical protein
MSFPSLPPSSARTARKNAWYGLGVTVETQLLVGGMETMLARMKSFEGSRECYIRVKKLRAGPGLGGGADGTLVLASGVPTAYDFTNVEIESGWGLSLRLLEGSSKRGGSDRQSLQAAHAAHPVGQTVADR